MDRKYLVGVVLVAVSAVIWSSAGIFTRGVAADAWAVIFWRGVAAAGFTLAYLMLRGVLAKEIRQFTGPSLLISVLGHLVRRRLFLHLSCHQWQMLP